MREHQAIARAIADRDRDAAAEAMRAHLTESRDRLLPVFADFDRRRAIADVAVESSA